MSRDKILVLFGIAFAFCLAIVLIIGGLRDRESLDTFKDIDIDIDLVELEYKRTGDGSKDKLFKAGVITIKDSDILKIIAEKLRDERLLQQKNIDVKTHQYHFEFVVYDQERNKVLRMTVYFKKGKYQFLILNSTLKFRNDQLGTYLDGLLRK